MTDDDNWLYKPRTPDEGALLRWLTYITIGCCLVVGFAILFTFLG